MLAFSNHLDISSIAPLERYTRVLALCIQGGGLFIGTGGTATLNECNIYDNTATYVRLPSEHVTFHIAPLEPVLLTFDFVLLDFVRLCAPLPTAVFDSVIHHPRETYTSPAGTLHKCARFVHSGRGAFHLVWWHGNP